jgi:hypothetical protein
MVEMTTKSRQCQPVPDGAEHLSRLATHVTEIQERQLAVLQQAANELALVKQRLNQDQKQVEAAHAQKEPYLAKISELNRRILALEDENYTLRTSAQQIEQQYYNYTIQLQRSFNTLRETLLLQAQTLDQQVRLFTVDSSRHLDNILQAVDAVEFPSFQHVTPVSTPEQTQRRIEQGATAVEAELDRLEKDLHRPVPAPPLFAPTAPLAQPEPTEADKKKKDGRRFRLRLFSRKKLTSSQETAITTPAIKEKKPVAVAEPKKKEGKIVAPVEPIVEEPVKEKKSQRHPVRRFVVRTAVWALILGGGYYGWATFKHTTQANLQQALSNHPTSSVAGASTDSATTSSTAATADPTTNTDMSDRSYPESFAELPFDQTVWETTTDPDLGITIDYPKNTTNRVRIIGGNNLWFLRKNGYLVKVSRFETSLQLNDWWAINKQDYTSDNTVDKTTFKNLPAWHVTPIDKTDYTGDSYFVRRNDSILQIWIKNEDPTTDDGQRLQRMVNSLQFLGK